MTLVLVGQDDVGCREAPVDSERRIVPGDGALGGRLVEVVAVVLEDGLAAQDPASLKASVQNSRTV